jgi:hypothetical protein
MTHRVLPDATFSHLHGHGVTPNRVLESPLWAFIAGCSAPQGAKRGRSMIALACGCQLPLKR